MPGPTDVYLQPFLDDLENNPEGALVLRLHLDRLDKVRAILFSNLHDEEKVTQLQALFAPPRGDRS